MENILRHPAVRLLFLIMMIWSLFSLLNRLFGSSILILLVCVFIVVGIVNWMLKHQRAQLAKVYPYPGMKQFINLICKLTHSQPPVEGAAKRDTQEEQLLLKSFAEFRAAEEELRKVVRGHDLVISQVLTRLRENLLLRSKIQLPHGAPPLASFLLLGEPGIGKRHLATEIGRRLYRQSAVLSLSLRDYSGNDGAAEALFGSLSTTGLLLAHVRSKPFHSIILEDIEAASPLVLENLGRLLKSGTAIDPATKTSVSFQHSVFFFTSSLELPKLRLARKNIRSQFEWTQTITNVLASHSELDSRLLAGLSDFLLFDSPNSVTRAEVLLLLAEHECRKYGISLQYVDPEILADEVAVVSMDCGFELAPARIERLLKRPLIRAAKTGSPRVSLRSQDALTATST